MVPNIFPKVARAAGAHVNPHSDSAAPGNQREESIGRLTLHNVYYANHGARLLPLVAQRAPISGAHTFPRS